MTKAPFSWKSPLLVIEQLHFLFLLVRQFSMGPQIFGLLSPAGKCLCWTSPENYTFQRLYFLCEGMSCVQKNRSDLTPSQYCQSEKLTQCWQVLWFFKSIWKSWVLCLTSKFKTWILNVEPNFKRTLCRANKTGLCANLTLGHHLQSLTHTLKMAKLLVSLLCN